tara:strand:+ start:781 stop:1266 length:486 start_codon:yes stop_codon:yes gene_type:complete
MTIQTFKYPEYKKLNDILYPIIRDAKKYHISEGTGKRTTFNIHRRKELRGFVDWMCKLFPDYKIAISWGVVYNKGEGARKHSHEPYPMTFVYYVNLPEGSSPLIVEDEVINISSGELVVLPGNKFHEVPSSIVDSRCVIAGNIESTSFLDNIFLYFRKTLL